MQRLLVSCAAVMLLAGAARAQGVPPAGAQAPAPPRPGALEPPPPPPPGGNGTTQDDAGSSPPASGQRPAPPSRGAHIHVEQRGTLLDIQCNADEPIRTCADAVTAILDHLGATAKR